MDFDALEVARHSFGKLGRFRLPAWVSDPFNGSTGLADERHVFVLIEIATEVVTLKTRGYDHQES